MLQLLQLAGEIANVSTDRMRKSFMGCVAVRRDGTLVYSRNGSTTEFNCAKTHSAHAEYRVLRKSGYGATIYVARVQRNGDYAMAKPCKLCHTMLRIRGVSMIYYTVSNTEWKAYHP